MSCTLSLSTFFSLKFLILILGALCTFFCVFQISQNKPIFPRLIAVTLCLRPVPPEIQEGYRPLVNAITTVIDNMDLAQISLPEHLTASHLPVSSASIRTNTPHFFDQHFILGVLNKIYQTLLAYCLFSRVVNCFRCNGECSSHLLLHLQLTNSFPWVSLLVHPQFLPTK